MRDPLLAQRTTTRGLSATIISCAPRQRWPVMPVLLAATISAVLIMPASTKAQALARQPGIAVPASRTEVPAADAFPDAAAPVRTGAAAKTVPDAIDQAMRAYRETGAAHPTTAGPVTLYPFGHATPVLTCTPLRACTIQLEDGEALVHEPIAGDTQRWKITPAAAGGDGRSTIVVVKPTECGITTNTVLSTDRRLYDLTLDSPPCSSRTTNPAGQGGRQIRFYYPDEPVRTAPGAEAAIDTVGIRIVELNRNYRLPRKPKFPWTPAEIFDDGAHVYIRVPESARHHEAPVLYALDEDGTRVLVNYTLRGDTYVTDRTFRRGLLVLGSRTSEQTLQLENRAWGATRLPAPPASATTVPPGGASR